MSKKRNRINPDGTIEGTCTVLNENLDVNEEEGENEGMNNQDQEGKKEENQNPTQTPVGEEKKDWFGKRLWKKTPTPVKIGIGAIGVGVIGFLAGCFFAGTDGSPDTPVLPDPDDDEDETDSYDDEDSDNDSYEGFISEINNITQDAPSTDETTVEG